MRLVDSINAILFLDETRLVLEVLCGQRRVVLGD